jgi:hypothetical protein
MKAPGLRRGVRAKRRLLCDAAQPTEGPNINDGPRRPAEFASGISTGAFNPTPTRNLNSLHWSIGAREPS